MKGTFFDVIGWGWPSNTLSYTVSYIYLDKVYNDLSRGQNALNAGLGNIVLCPDLS